MTSEQAAQLIDDTLDLVHQRLQDLQAQALPREQRALAEEFREWRNPVGGHIDLMVFPGLGGSCTRLIPLQPLPIKPSPR